jgi:hypothetical protein
MNDKKVIKNLTEKDLSKLTSIQGILMGIYGICAIAMYIKMHTYNINSISIFGPLVHFSYILNVGTGMFQIIYRIAKKMDDPEFVKSNNILMPIIMTAASWICSQANKVYICTKGGSVFGLVRYFLNALMSGKDPVDAFVYGKLTVLKYLMIMIIGFSVAIYTISKRRRTASCAY